MNDSRNPHVGIEALLTPQNSVLLLIDHQPFQFANLHSHEPTLIVNNVVGLAKTAKVFQVPTILTTVLEERGGLLIKDVQDVFPDQKPINRTFINAWEDKRVVEAVKKTGVCRNGCFWWGFRRGARHGNSAHGAGRRNAYHLACLVWRVAARLGAH